MPDLSEKDLVDLVRSVFPGHPGDRTLGILVDVPREPGRDNPAWKARREMAEEWRDLLERSAASVPLDDVRLIAYPDVGSNNADLPADATVVDGRLPPSRRNCPAQASRMPFEAVFRRMRSSWPRPSSRPPPHSRTRRPGISSARPPCPASPQR